MRPTILVVDDEKRLCRALEILFREEGPFDVFSASDYYSALEAMKEKPIDVVLTDLTMPGKTGLDLLRAIRADKPLLPVILMTAYSTVESAVAAMKEGATDYIVKPFENNELLALIRKSLRIRGDAEAHLGVVERYGDLLGQSVAMQDVFDKIQRSTDSEATVLITGESGTGKELVAKAIHFGGARKAKPFIPLNCTAVPENLLESELFGHEKGAFTGADRMREGKFELAHQGTLFLDEIGDMSVSLQAKLLRVLQEREFLRVGGDKVIRVDVRIIAATNRNLSELVANGKFREDLFYRLNVVVIQLPPLRERREDIPMLIDHFLLEKSRKNGVAAKSLSQSARLELYEYSYPGNVRELENLIERAVVMSRGAVIEKNDLPLGQGQPNVAGVQPSIPLEKGFEVVENLKQKMEREIIERALRLYPTKSNSELAELLGTSRRVLESRMKAYGLEK